MEMVINFGIERDKKRLFEVLKTRKPKAYVIEIKEHRASRSNAQNRYYWGVVLKILAAEFGTYEEEMHEYMKRLHNPKPILTKHGEEILLGGTTAEMDTKDFTDYLERIRIWALTEFDVQIPLPGEFTEV